MGRLLRTSLALALVIGAGVAVAGDRGTAAPVFVYEDLDRFAKALQAIDEGAQAEPTIAKYVAEGSPAYPPYVARYDVTAQSIAAALAKRPRHYRRVAALKPYLLKQEKSVSRAMARLNDLIPGPNVSPPIFYLVGNMYAGGIQVELAQPLKNHRRGVVLLLEALAMAPETDMSEFQGSAYSGGYLEDIPYVAVHESVHVYQFDAMGADNYVSIYQSGNPNNVYLALAIREGCADYLTYLATGTRRRGNQQSYGEANERELWQQFQQVMYSPASFADGWFGGLDPRTPDWPPQIGYWLGSRMCQAYVEAAPDRDTALRHIINAYRIDDMRPIAEAYARKFID